MLDAFKLGEKWTMVIPSTINVDFFYSRAHEIKQIPTGVAGLIDMVKKTSFGLVSFDLVPISRRTMSSKLGFFRLRFQHSEGTKSQK